MKFALTILVLGFAIAVLPLDWALLPWSLACFYAGWTLHKVADRLTRFYK